MRLSRCFAISQSWWSAVYTFSQNGTGIYQNRNFWFFSGPRFFKSVFWGKLKRLILSPVLGVILPRVVVLYHFHISSPVYPLKMRRGAPRSFISIVRLAIPSAFRLYNAHETLCPLSIYSYRPRYDVLKFCPWMLTAIVSNTLRAHPLILSLFLAPKIAWDI